MLDLTKEIQPYYETIGTRRRLTGYEATVRDGDTVIFANVYATQHAAEVEADRFVYDLLTSDLVISATALDGVCAEHGQAFNEYGMCETCVEPVPFTDVCPSCGDQLSWEGPGLCGACQEACETYPESAPTICAAIPTPPAPIPPSEPSPDDDPADWRQPQDRPAALLALWRSDKAALCRRLASYSPAQFREQVINVATYLHQRYGSDISDTSLWLIWRDFVAEARESEPPQGPDYLWLVA